MLESLNLSKTDFLAMADVGKVIPITLRIFGGNETPVGLFEKISAGKSGTFLLESAEQGVWSRYSFIGVSSRSNLVSTHGRLASSDFAKLFPTADHEYDSALVAVDAIQKAWRFESVAGLPPLTSGLVGLFSWDVIREIEKLPAPVESDYEHPLVHLEMVQDVIVVDHKDNCLLLVSNVYCDTETAIELGYSQAVERIEKMYELVSQAAAPRFTSIKTAEDTETKSNFSREAFLNAVELAKGYVRIGDVFQVVLSQRFDIQVTAKPIDVYRVLRSLNPSPYMYLLNFEDQNGPYAVIGSSPEALVKVSGGRAIMHPIAGSRPRGSSAKEDNDLAESLLGDQKERAEHLMLVDLARNDLLKVSAPDSIKVTEFMKIERFSHIMHLVSTVESILEAGSSPIDVLKATFPAGTLSGAPKPRALEIISELEPTNRGIFGGVVGYLDFAGNADLAIAIRTAFVRDDLGHVQAGAGIVLDSDPESEYMETINKASAVISAIKQANAMFGH
ncbi:MAG: chorismate-binding protein [Acidobacteria bacterium]|nr:chorismate-binding protein [Acidobacteriota bacterium]